MAMVKVTHEVKLHLLCVAHITVTTLWLLNMKTDNFLLRSAYANYFLQTLMYLTFKP